MIRCSAAGLILSILCLASTATAQSPPVIVYPAGAYTVTTPGPTTITYTAASVTFSWAVAPTPPRRQSAPAACSRLLFLYSLAMFGPWRFMILAVCSPAAQQAAPNSATLKASALLQDVDVQPFKSTDVSVASWLPHLPKTGLPALLFVQRSSAGQGELGLRRGVAWLRGRYPVPREQGATANEGNLLGSGPYPRVAVWQVRREEMKLRGAIPSPRCKAFAAHPHKATAVPDSWGVIPTQLSIWGNSTYGDCVSAEEAAAKAQYSTMCGLAETFISDSEVVKWARSNGFLNGANLTDVMEAMAKSGMTANGQTYGDGAYQSVDWTNDAVLSSAVSTRARSRSAWRPASLRVSSPARMAGGPPGSPRTITKIIV